MGLRVANQRWAEGTARLTAPWGWSVADPGQDPQGALGLEVAGQDWVSLSRQHKILRWGAQPGWGSLEVPLWSPGPTRSIPTLSPGQGWSHW